MNFSIKLYELLSRIPGMESAGSSIRDYWTLLREKNRGTFSQHGEDTFLAEYFSGITGVYIDIGASHPFRISNTYLLYKHGWSGVTVEPIEYLSAKHRRWRPRDQQCCEAVGDKDAELTFYELVPSVLSTFDYDSALETIKNGGVLRKKRAVKMTTLKSLKQRYYPEREIELLSIDAEGLDFAILSGNDWSECRPKIVIFEANDNGDDRADQLLLRNRYRFLKTLGCNRLYERNDT